MVFATLLLAACTLEHEVSRVAIPNTSLTVVVVEDEKSLYRIRIYENGKRSSSDEGIFGSRHGIDRDAPLPAPVVTRTASAATLAWPGTNLKITIDVKHGTAIDDSHEVPTAK